MYSPESSISRSTNSIIDRTHQLVSNEDISLVLNHISPGEKKLNANIIEKIKVYQRTHNLDPDGIIGRLTLNSIKRHSILDQANNTVPKNNLSILQAKVPESMRGVYKEFLEKCTSEDIRSLSTGAPCILVDSTNQKGCIVSTDSVFSQTFPVILGKGGLREVGSRGDMNELKGSGKTGTGLIYHFDTCIIPGDPLANSSRSGKAPGVVGATLCSPEGIAGGGRWFHGVMPEDKYTEGCIGLPIEIARLSARLVALKKGGFGYVN